MARPLTLLYGIQPAVLRDVCLREASQLTGRWPERRAIILVPEQAKLDVERQYLAISGRRSLMMAEVLSFRRLAVRLAGEIGRESDQLLNQTGQVMLLHRILHQRQKELAAFANLADRPGFMPQIASVINDLRRFRLDAETLQDISDRLPERSLQNKVKDLAVILADYQAALEHFSLTDPESDLARLCDWLQKLQRQVAAGVVSLLTRQLDWLQRTSVWVCGFGELRDFSPQEYQVLQALTQCCEQVTVSVLADLLPADELAVELGADLFMAGRRCAYHLLQRWPTVRTRRLEASWSAPAAVLAGRLGVPADWLGPGSGPAGADQVRLVQARDSRQAIAWVAGEIRRQVLAGAYRYADISIAVCNPAADLDQIRAIFHVYQIPLFLDAVRPLSGTPLMRYMLGLLDISRFGWSRQAVMQILRSGLTGLTRPDVDQMENFWLAYGLFRPDRLFAVDLYDVADPRAALARQGIEQILAPLRRLHTGMQQAATCQLLCDQLLNGLEALALPAQIEQMTQNLLNDGDPDSALALVKAWNALGGLLAQLQLLTGATPMTVQAFRNLLAAGMDNADSGVIPSALDQVNIASLERSRLRPCKLLYVIGATAAGLPPPPPPEGLLKDTDRLSLSLLLGQNLPSSVRDQAFADAAMIYSLLILPTDQLCLVAGGEDLSIYMHQLAELSGRPPQLLADEPDWRDPRLQQAAPALARLLQICRQMPGPGADFAGWATLAAALQQGGVAMEPLRQWLERSRSLQVALAPDLVSQTYGSLIQMSVSQLERYAGCPFQHLVHYGLALQARRIWQPEATDSGTLLHALVEQCIRMLQADLAQADSSQAVDQILARWLAGGLAAPVDYALAQLRDDARLRLFFDPGLQASAGRRMRRMALTSLEAILRQLQSDDFQPLALEWSFGPSEGSGLAVDIGEGREVNLRGKIDRVDALIAPAKTSGPGLFRIIDYKTGDVKINFETLYHGLALQLPAYLAAFTASHPGWRAVDACYFHFDQPIFSQAEDAALSAAELERKLSRHFSLRGLSMAQDDLLALQGHTLQRIRQWANLLLRGEFSACPRKITGHQPACVYCQYNAVCGFDRRQDRFDQLPPLSGLLAADCRPPHKKDQFLQLLHSVPPGSGAEQPGDSAG